MNKKLSLIIFVIVFFWSFLFLSFISKEENPQAKSHLQVKTFSPLSSQKINSAKRILASKKKLQIKEPINIKEDKLNPLQENFAMRFYGLRFYYQEGCFQELRDKCQQADDQNCLKKLNFTQFNNEDERVTTCLNSFNDPDVGPIEYFNEYENGFLKKYHYKVADIKFEIGFNPRGDLEFLSFHMERIDHEFSMIFEGESLGTFLQSEEGKNGGYGRKIDIYTNDQYDEAHAKSDLDEEAFSKRMHKLQAQKDHIEDMLSSFREHIRTLCNDYGDDKSCEMKELEDW